MIWWLFRYCAMVQADYPSSGRRFDVFIDLLQKLSAAASLEEMQSQLEPGDILLTTYSKPPGRIPALIRKAATRLTGSYGHVGIYAGDGEVIESVWGAGVRSVPLDQVARKVNVIAVRPEASKRDRRKAVQFARERIGDPYRNLGTLEIAAEAISPGFLNRIAGVRNPEARALLCTELVDQAYGGRFSQGRVPLSVDFAAPGRSTLVGWFDAASPEEAAHSYGPWARSPERGEVP